MSGHRNVNELLRPIMENPERRARVAEEKRIMDAILTLHERRERMGATQEELAHALDVSRTTVFDMEHKRHMYTSTIGSYVEALGGKLELCAIFPDQTIRLGPVDPNTQEECVEEGPVKTATG